MSQSDPSDVVPDGLTLADLRERERSSSSTPDAERKRCPDCNSPDVVSLTKKPVAPTQYDHDYRCGKCQFTFDEPARGGR